MCRLGTRLIAASHCVRKSDSLRCILGQDSNLSIIKVWSVGNTWGCQLYWWCSSDHPSFPLTETMENKMWGDGFEGWGEVLACYMCVTRGRRWQEKEGVEDPTCLVLLQRGGVWDDCRLLGSCSMYGSRRRNRSRMSSHGLIEGPMTSPPLPGTGPVPTLPSRALYRWCDLSWNLRCGEQREWLSRPWTMWGQYMTALVMGCTDWKLHQRPKEGKSFSVDMDDMKSTAWGSSSKGPTAALFGLFSRYRLGNHPSRKLLHERVSLQTYTAGAGSSPRQRVIFKSIWLALPGFWLLKETL